MLETTEKWLRRRGSICPAPLTGAAGQFDEPRPDLRLFFRDRVIIALVEKGTARIGPVCAAIGENRRVERREMLKVGREVGIARFGENPVEPALVPAEDRLIEKNQPQFRAVKIVG